MKMTASSKIAANMFIACENKDAFLRARRVERQLENACGPRIKISPVFWNFALMRHAGLRECAVAEAARAEVVVLSVYPSGDDLPPHVKCWLESLPARQQGEGALVVLVGSREDPWAPAPPYLGYLRQIAAYRGLDFFSNRDERQRLTAFRPARFTLAGANGRAMTPAKMSPDHVPWFAEEIG